MGVNGVYKLRRYPTITTQNYYPVVYPTYVAPFYPYPLPLWPSYDPEPTKDTHKIVKPTAVHTTNPINVDELVGMSKLSLGEQSGAESNQVYRRNCSKVRLGSLHFKRILPRVVQEANFLFAMKNPYEVVFNKARHNTTLTPNQWRYTIHGQPWFGLREETTMTLDMLANEPHTICHYSIYATVINTNS
ncbi:hypothetical protein RND81_13G026200 [Saponaria officinalis]|uniref:Uncharacterized protein n=1 Tax=Saponaria officinalis TaxID=3572 RepID=A0AAW1GXX5_SAPOF